MATLVAWVQSVAAPDPYDMITVSGSAQVEIAGPASPFMWTAYVAFGSTEAQYGAACLAAAVAAAAVQGITVGPSDQKRLFGSAVDPSIGALAANATSAAAMAQTTADAAALAAAGAQTTANTAQSTAATAQSTAAAASSTAAAASTAAANAQSTASSAATAAALAVQQPTAGAAVSLALNTSRRPSTTRGTRVTVYGTWSWSLSVIGTVAGSAALVSDASATPTTQRGVAPFSRTVGVGITVADSGSFPWSMTYDVPAGHYYRINTSGAGTLAIAHINETPL